MKFRHTHDYHMVSQSPWPIFAAYCSLLITVGAVLCFHFYNGGSRLLFGGLLFLTVVLTLWWRDVIREGTFQKLHTRAVDRGLRMGMILFIVSEVMFFFAFFWAFFHSSLAPTIQLGCIWPPAGIAVLSAWKVPLLNTMILLTSGATITVAHYALILEKRKDTIAYFIFTILLALLFTFFQLWEYYNAAFSINDSVYGSTFYMSTGFHGFHVIIGTTFIIVCLARYVNHHFTPKNHMGFEFAAWYWHFVDVVWLFLYACVYIWGNY